METLRSLCIDVIVVKFDRYVSACYKTDDANYKRKFEFLQRKYSFEIISRLHEDGNMKEKYIDFLINKHIQYLNAGWFIVCSWETVCSKLKEVGSNIKKMYFFNDLEDTWHIKPWHEIMRYLSHLEVVTFNTVCNDEFLESISKFCPNIVEIHAIFSDITDEGVISLCRNENGKVSCPKLKKLFIANCRVTDESVKYAVKYLPLLEEIDHEALPNVLYSLHKNDLSSLDKIKPYNLNTLNLLHLNHLPYFTDLLKICLFLCPYLKTLCCPVLQKEHSELFSGLTQLETLHLESYAIENVNDIFKLIGQKLTTLKVSYGSFSICSVAENCPYLKSLYLNQVTFQNMDKNMPEFRCLDTCIFHCIEYNCEAAKAISVLLKSSPKLDHIGFMECDITSSELKVEILKCCKTNLVKKFNFSGSTLEVNFVKDILLSCYSLDTILLEYSNISKYDGYELHVFSESLPNNPEIFYSEDLSSSDLVVDHNSDGSYDDIYIPGSDEDYNDYDDDDDDDYNDPYGYFLSSYY